VLRQNKSEFKTYQKYLSELNQVVISKDIKDRRLEALKSTITKKSKKGMNTGDVLMTLKHTKLEYRTKKTAKEKKKQLVTDAEIASDAAAYRFMMNIERQNQTPVISLIGDVIDISM